MWQPMYRRTVMFLVKIWAEYAEQDPPAWRGELLCQDTGQRHRFKDLDELTALIKQHTDPIPSPITKEPHK